MLRLSGKGPTAVHFPVGRLYFQAAMIIPTMTSPIM